MRLGSFFIINLALLTVAIAALVRRAGAGCRLRPASDSSMRVTPAARSTANSICGADASAGRA